MNQTLHNTYTCEMEHFKKAHLILVLCLKGACGVG